MCEGAVGPVGSAIAREGGGDAIVSWMGFLAIDRRGTFRLTICVGPWAIKIARGSTARACNEYAAALWKRTPPRRREMLCPVLLALPGGLALVMQRAEPLSEQEGDHLLETDGLPDWDYMPPDDEGSPLEPKACDWGRLPDGRLVALDYSTPAWGTRGAKEKDVAI